MRPLIRSVAGRVIADLSGARARRPPINGGYDPPRPLGPLGGANLGSVARDVGRRIEGGVPELGSKQEGGRHPGF